MEKMYFENTLTDETGGIANLHYTVFPEEVYRDMPSQYSLSVEKKTLHNCETAAVHCIGNKNEVLTLAELLCRNTVTPVTLYDIVEDYITGKALV